MEYTTAEKELKKILSMHSPDKDLQDVVDFLYENFTHYSWVGIYFVKGNQIILGPWKGKHATEHTQIPLGKGICGSAALSGKTEIVDDVSKDSRYLSCFLSTKSEIVVPINKNKKVIGEVDIDSDTPSAFQQQDAMFLEKIADMLSQHI